MAKNTVSQQDDVVLVVAPPTNAAQLQQQQQHQHQHQHQHSKKRKPKPDHWWRRGIFRRRPKPDDILTPHEREVLRRFHKRAKMLDRQCGCCGCGVGLDPVLGLIPVVGDFAGAALGLALVLSVSHDPILALQKPLVSHMLANVAFDFLIGFFPVIGDYFDFLFASNLRNAELLERYLLKRAIERVRTGNPDHQLQGKDEWECSSASSSGGENAPREITAGANV